MSGRGLVTLGVFLAAVVLTGVGAVKALAKDPVTDVSGQVTAPCPMLVGHPAPGVFSLDGSRLPGSSWISAPTQTGNGRCTSAFRVSDVPVLDSYRVAVGSTSVAVTRTMTQGLELTA